MDSVEPKLFGIGAESYTSGSHEFYLGYAVSRQNPAHPRRRATYHPTEGIADKISSVLCYLPEIALHVSRGVRWDSDHVVTLTDDLQAIAQEIVWGGYLGRVRIGLDYFDASINRVAAWVIGTRNMLKALLLALLAPIAKLRQLEARGRLHLAPGVDGGRQAAAGRRGVGLLLCPTRACPSARPGWRK